MLLDVVRLAVLLDIGGVKSPRAPHAKGEVFTTFLVELLVGLICVQQHLCQRYYIVPYQGLRVEVEP